MSASEFEPGNNPEPASSQEMKESFRHMDALFALAQVLTLDAEKASRLVEATYLHAHKQTDQHRLAIDDRRYLLQLLIQIYRHQNEAPPQLFASDSDDDTGATRSPSSESFKQRLLDNFLKQAVPVAFATMNHSDRVLLTLCDVERLSCADAALIVGGDSDTICAQLQAARLRLQKIVTENAPPAEAHLLRQTDTREWIPATLRRTVKSDFTALPPTLEPRIRSTLFKDQDPSDDRRASLSGSGNYRKTGLDQPRRSRLIRGLMTALMILGTGMVGYFGSALLAREPESNLVMLSVLQAPRVEPLLKTTDFMEAEQFVRQQLNWRLHLPAITDGGLTGVGISEIASGVRVPVFLYSDQTNDDEGGITLYAFDYALLDRYKDRIQLEQDVLIAIASENHFDLHDLSEKNKVLIWRHDNDIFMAVTSGDARDLRERIDAR